jgi:CspA family cold shock protein
MNLFTKLVISLVTAAIAAFAIKYFNLHGTLQLWLIVATATVATTLLSQLKLLKPAVAKASKGSAAPKKKQPAKKSKPSQKSTPAKASKSSGKREEGEVKWFNASKGFGFIIRENGEEIFVHFRSIRGDDAERRGLRDGQRVSFEVANSDKGPQAEEVEAL